MQTRTRRSADEKVIKFFLANQALACNTLLSLFHQRIEDQGEPQLLNAAQLAGGLFKGPCTRSTLT
jgi:hypothetical protein